VDQTGSSAYDNALYESHAFPQSEPDRLATLATLFGLAPAPVDCCRVLELGCASGGNLLPQAQTYPRSQYVGIDLSARQIANASNDARALGLGNAEFMHLGITDVDAGLGEFDYVIAHGVYSWVPAETRAKLLKICKRNLSPRGVAYVSYNAYPAWHTAGMAREMMRYRVDRLQDPATKAAQARKLLFFVADAQSGRKDAYSVMLQQELGALAQKADYYLLHDHLEADNAPVYFHQFAQQAADHGLQYLCEAQFHLFRPQEFAAELEARLDEAAPDIIRVEQYFDFVRNCRFRQTLLVHEDATIDRSLSWQQLRKLRIASDATPVSIHSHVRSAAPQEFRSSGNVSMVVAEPAIKAMLGVLADRWPDSLPFEVLCESTWHRLDGRKSGQPSGAPEDDKVLGRALLDAYAQGIVQFRTVSPPFVTGITERPRANALALLQATRATSVTNAFHAQVTLEPLPRFVLRLLDGVHHSRDIESSLAAAIVRGDQVLKRHGRPLPVEHALPVVPQAVQECLRFLAANALLIG
jgi:methyltransferase-like protein/2-polyprenyl-3-methyl-5-hydroxy-6-metoxy-1,4-benzoquinol methylase